MKKLSVFVLFGLVLAIGAMSYFAALDSARTVNNLAAMGRLMSAERALGDLSLDVERLRSAASRFRKLGPAETTATLKTGRDSFRKALSELRGSLDESERQRTVLIGDKLEELVATSERLLPTLYSKDPFAVEEVRSLHEEAQSEIAALSVRLQERANGLSEFAERGPVRKAQVFLIGGGVILLLFVSVLLVGYRVYHQPLVRLFAYASGLSSGKRGRSSGQEGEGEEEPLPGMHGTVHATLSRLAMAAETHLRERHKFILDLVADLAAPLLMLKAGRELMVNRLDSSLPEEPRDPELDRHAAESIRCGIAVLSGGLDDLVDLASLGTIENRLEEKLVDLSELVMNVSRTLTCSSYGKQVVTAVPPMPIWIRLDARRMERALTHAVLKVASTASSGTVRVAVSEPSQAGCGGVEILVQDAERQREKRGSTGPELDVTRHWIGESGVTLALARKVIQAQGGAMTASGVSGTSAQIRIRLPQERLVTRGLINPPVESGMSIGLEVDYARLAHVPQVPSQSL